MRHTAFRHLTAAILLAMTATAPAMAQSPVTDPGPATTAAPATEGVQAAPQPVTGEVLPAAEDAATTTLQKTRWISIYQKSIR